MFVASNYLVRQVALSLRNRDLWETSFEISRFFYKLFDLIAIDVFGYPIEILTVWPITIGIALIGVVLWLFHGLSGAMEPWRSERLRRKQLGLLFATL